MEGLFGAIIFIVVIIASIAQKIQERRAAKSAPRPLSREDIPEAAQRQLYGDPSAEPRVATVKAATSARPQGQQAPREAQPAQRAAPPAAPPGKELFDSMFGGPAAKEAEEPQPVPSPAQRRPEPQRPAPAPATTAREQPREVRVPPKRQQTTATRTPQRQSASPRQQAEADSRAARQAERATQRQQKAARQRPAQSVSRTARAPGPLALFGSADDVRRGIIVAEVLGPPKAFQDGP